MAETDFIPIKAARFRTSRYPGFVGGSIDPVTGNLRPGFPTLTPNAGETTDPTAEEEKPTARFRGLRRFVNNPVTEHEPGESERLKTESATREQRYQFGKAIRSPLERGLSAFLPGGLFLQDANLLSELEQDQKNYRDARDAGVSIDNAKNIETSAGLYKPAPSGGLSFGGRQTPPGFETLPDPNTDTKVTVEDLPPPPGFRAAPPRSGLHSITRNPVEQSRGIFSEAARNEADSGGYDERAGGGSRSREDIDDTYGEPFSF